MKFDKEIDIATTGEGQKFRDILCYGFGKGILSVRRLDQLGMRLVIQNCLVEIFKENDRRVAVCKLVNLYEIES